MKPNAQMSFGEARGHLSELRQDLDVKATLARSPKEGIHPADRLKLAALDVAIAALQKLSEAESEAKKQ